MFTSLKAEQGQDLYTYTREDWQPVLWLGVGKGSGGGWKKHI